MMVSYWSVIGQSHPILAALHESLNQPLALTSISNPHNFLILSTFSSILFKYLVPLPPTMISVSQLLIIVSRSLALSLQSSVILSHPRQLMMGWQLFQVENTILEILSISDLILLGWPVYWLYSSDTLYRPIRHSALS